MVAVGWGRVGVLEGGGGMVVAFMHVRLYDSECCVGLDPSEGTVRGVVFLFQVADMLVALGSTRVRVLQVSNIADLADTSAFVALGSTRVRVLQGGCRRYSVYSWQV